MKFSEPETVDEVVTILSADSEARCLAGGATLVAMLNADLVAPTQLIGLGRVHGLDRIERLADGAVRIGAMARHAEVAAFAGFAGGQAIVPAAALRIGHPAIRNMGTIAGSICHADPAADYPTAITAANAAVEIAGPGGARAVAADEFFVDWFETALEPAEMVTAVTVPPDPHGARVHYEKFNRADGDFATVSVAACVALDGDVCRSLRVVVGGVAGAPVHSREREGGFVGRLLDDASIAELGRALAEDSNPIDDMRGSAAYRLRLIPRLVARAVNAAVAASAESEAPV